MRMVALEIPLHHPLHQVILVTEQKIDCYLLDSNLFNYNNSFSW